MNEHTYTDKYLPTLSSIANHKNENPLSLRHGSRIITRTSLFETSSPPLKQQCTARQVQEGHHADHRVGGPHKGCRRQVKIHTLHTLDTYIIDTCRAEHFNSPSARYLPPYLLERDGSGGVAARSSAVRSFVRSFVRFFFRTTCPQRYNLHNISTGTFVPCTNRS